MSANSSVLLFGASKDQFDGNNITFVTLPHPRYGPTPFAMSSGSYFELQKAQPRKFGSWFVNQRVLSNSSYMIASKFDIRYVLLPFFEKSGERYSPLDQIVSHMEGCDRINVAACDKWGLDAICDINDKFGDDMILYRMNPEKVLAWLRQRVSSASEVVRRHRLQSAADSLKVSSFNSAAQSGNNVATTDQIIGGVLVFVFVF